MLISEVAVVAGAKLPSLKQWIDTSLVTAPPRVGKHRRFGAAHTVEVILMNELNSLGIKPSVVAGWLRMIWYSFLGYIDACAVEENGIVRMTEKLFLGLWVTPNGCITVNQVDEESAVGQLPQHSLVLHCHAIFEKALTRAFLLKRRPLTPNEALKAAWEPDA